MVFNETNLKELFNYLSTRKYKYVPYDKQATETQKVLCGVP